MFGLLSLVSTLFSIKELANEKTEPVTPKGTRFDWDAYREDIRNCIGVMEQIKKRKHDEYMTTKPPIPKWYELPIDTVIDTERYEHDKKVYGEDTAEYWRRTGSYRRIKS